MPRVTSFGHEGLLFPVRDEGPLDGDVVLLLHGFPQDPSAFDGVVPLLHEGGLRTLVPGLPADPAAGRPRRRRDYSMRRLVGDVLALLDLAAVEEPARVHVVGHDWGAATAWALASWHPERVASLTVLSTPHPAALTRSLLRSTQGARSWYVAFFQLPLLPEHLLPRVLTATLRDSGLPPVQAERYAAAMRVPGAARGALGWYRGLAFSRRPGIGHIGVPTTYLWGRDDAALGRAAAAGTACHVSADYRFLELDAGHWLPETRPAEVAAAVLARAGR